MNTDSSPVPNRLDEVKQLTINGITVWEEHLLEELRRRRLGLCYSCQTDCSVRQELDDICESEHLGLLISHCRNWSR